MLYSGYRRDPPQVRTRCRNPRCAGKLKIPAANPRDAFCCASCEVAFYGVRCRVCESLFTPKTKRRQVCWRDKCRYAFKRDPERFALRCEPPSYPGSPIAHNAKKNSTTSKLKTAAKSGRGWHVVAGPEVHPINLADFPANAAARQTGRRCPVLITRHAPPVNIVGGYRFPGAPKVDLSLGTIADARPPKEERGLGAVLKSAEEDQSNVGLRGEGEQP
ncbi:hypothetical protein [Bradyrhizobium sp. 31Argb]|uniref:hypothetical protein n=1 Tax=Bradyrhizobium sp. 31Argb TaxID=3141247 RepID=UPI003748249F